MKTLSASEAAAALGVTPATLYAYVSRGLIRSEAGADARSRRYREEDVVALRQRKEARRDPARLVETALNWGSPVLESGISLIAEGHLYYRGRDAAELAVGATVEQVAGLLWQGPGAPAIAWPAPPPYWPKLQAVDLGRLSPLERLGVLVPLAGACDLAALDLRPQGILAAAGRIVALLTWALCGRWPEGDLAATLARTLAPDRPEARSLLSAALVLSADHELNASAFAARCTASAGATPYGAISAGLSAIGGTRHGGYQQRVEAFFDAVGSPPGAQETLARWLRGGEAIPGFGHSLYSGGDPRGRLLVELASGACPTDPAVTLAGAIAQGALELLQERPNIDFGLVTVARALDLPAGSSLGLFALGRSLGWLAHAMEQYADGRLIRPRARYCGPLPETSPR